uniref:SGNH_hydro domain-containing protein n=1 Tax=Macrostomum lignano TaxID=282301 RepID=A0A1I8I9L1_9PLAT
ANLPSVPSTGSTGSNVLNPTLPVDLLGDGRWLSQHKRFREKAVDREPDVIFIGDNIVQRMQFTSTWQDHIEPLHCLNFGIYEDRIENILYRIEDGELEDCSPKVVVLHAGNNNPELAADIAAGIRNLAEVVHRQLPGANVIVLGLLPVGEHKNPRRTKHAEVNRLLTEQLSQSGRTTVLIPDWDTFLQPDKSLSHRDMYDYCNLTDLGYSKLFEPLLELLQEELHSFPSVAAGDSDRE